MLTKHRVSLGIGLLLVLIFCSCVFVYTTFLQDNETLYFPTGRVEALKVSLDGSKLAAGGPGGLVIVWDINTRKQIGRFHNPPYDVKSIAFSPDDEYLAAAQFSNTLCVWPVSATRSAHALAGHSGEANCVAFSADGKLLASGSVDKTIRLWTIPRFEPLAVLPGHTAPISAIDFSRHSNLLASGTGSTERKPPIPGELKVWEVGTRSASRSTILPEGGILCLAFSVGGDLLATGGWEYHPNRVERHEKDRSTVTTTDEDAIRGVVNLWDPSTLNEPRRLPVFSGYVWQIAFSPKDHFLAVASGEFTKQSTVVLVDLETGKRETLVKSNKTMFTAVAFLPNRKTLVVGDDTGKIRFLGCSLTTEFDKGHKR